MAEDYAEYLALENKKNGNKKMKSTKKSKGGGSKVSPSTGSVVASGSSDAGSSQVTAEELALLEPLTTISAGGMCAGAPETITIAGLAAASARMMGLSSSQICRLRKNFKKADLARTGHITFPEFCDFIDAVDSGFTHKICHRMIFSFADQNSDGKISFDEFVLAAVILGSFSKDQILHIIFGVFDSSGDGYIDKKEFGLLAKAVDELSGNMFPGNYSSFLEGFDQDGDGLVDFGEFMKINEQFPMIFFPPIRMQDTMRKKTFGSDKWARMVDTFNASHRKKLDKEWEELNKQDKADGVEVVRPQLQATSFYEQIVKLSAKISPKGKRKQQKR